MVARTLPGLGLTGYWDLGADGWKDAMDVNLRLLSALCQCRAKSRTVVLPGSPSNGDIYIVKADAATNANSIALRDNGEWLYLPPAVGYIAYVADAAEWVFYNGTVWQTFGSEGGSSELPPLVGNSGKVLAVNAGEDGVEWVNPPDTGSSGGDGGVTTPKSKQWRIIVETNGGDIRTGTAEVELREVPGGPNIATGGNPTVSSAYTGTASTCFDGNINNYWLASAKVNEWVAYEFLVEVSINEVVIYSIANAGFAVSTAPKNFRIEYFDQVSASWQLAWSVVGATWTAASEPRTFTYPVYEEPLAKGAIRVVTKTASDTLALTDAGKYIRMAVGSPNLLTIPPNSLVAFPIGTQILIRQSGAGQTTVVADSGVTINTAETLLLRKQHSTATLVKIDADEWDLTGDVELAP